MHVPETLRESDQIPGYFRITHQSLDAAVGEADPAGGVPVEAHERVLRTAEQALAPVTAWTASYPIMGVPDDDHSRVVWTCLYCASAYPEGPVRLITDFSAFILASFSYDDVADGVFLSYPYPALESFARLCTEVGTGDRPTGPHGELSEPERQVLAAYQDCFRRISAYPAYQWAAPYLSRHWRQGFEAMLQASRWRLGLDSLPSLTEYLDNATFSLFGPLGSACQVVMNDLPSLSSSELDSWDEAARLSSLAIRLCNDLRTAERESKEGSHNALSLLILAGHTEQQAFTTVRAAVDAVLKDLRPAIDTLPAPLTGLGEFLWRTTRFVCDWYLARDTHGLTTRQLRHLLASRQQQNP